MRKLLVALLLILVALAVLAGVFLKRKGAILDTLEVERIAAQLLPGAHPPSGLRGVLAFKLDDLQVAILASGLPQARAENLQAGQLRIILASPQSGKPPQPSEILAKIDQVQQERSAATETLSKNPLALNIGGKPYPAQESKLKVREEGKFLREDFTIVLVEKHPVILILTGNEENFPEAARDQFLQGLQSPSGPPHPDLPTDVVNRFSKPPSGPPGLPAVKLPGPEGKPPGPPAVKPTRPATTFARPSIPKPVLPHSSGPHLPAGRPEMPGRPPGPPGF